MVCPPLWGTSRARMLKPSTVKVSPGMRPNRQSPRSSEGVIGKKGGDIMRASVASAPVSPPWSGNSRLTAASSRSPELKKAALARDPSAGGSGGWCRGTASRRAVRGGAGGRSGSSSSDGRPGGFTGVMRQRHTRGVPTEAGVVETGCGCRPPGPAECDAAPVSLASGSSRRCPADSSSKCVGAQSGQHRRRRRGRASPRCCST